MQNIDGLHIFPENVKLSSDSREVAVQIAGYIAKKFTKKEKKKYSCCKEQLTGKLSDDNEDHSYIRILSRGGLTIPPASLTDYVCTAFAILSISESTIKKSNLTVRKGAEVTLSHIIKNGPDFTCPKHVDAGKAFSNRVVSNIYFNNKRKILTAAVVKDNVTSFKKPQREKKGQ